MGSSIAYVVLFLPGWNVFNIFLRRKNKKEEKKKTISKILKETNFVFGAHAGVSLLFGFAALVLNCFDILGSTGLAPYSFEIPKNLKLGIEFAIVKWINVTLQQKCS